MKDKEWLKEEVQEILLTKKKEGINYYDYLDLKKSLWKAIDQTNFNISKKVTINHRGEMVTVENTIAEQ